MLGPIFLFPSLHILQASNSASSEASATAAPAKAVPYSAPHFPSPSFHPSRFSPKASLPDPFHCRTLWLPIWNTQTPMGSASLLHWKTSLCRLFLAMTCHLVSTTCSQHGHQLLGSVPRSLCLKPLLDFTKQVSLLGLCSYCGQCK